MRLGECLLGLTAKNQINRKIIRRTKTPAPTMIPISAAKLRGPSSTTLSETVLFEFEVDDAAVVTTVVAAVATTVVAPEDTVEDTVEDTDVAPEVPAVVVPDVVPDVGPEVPAVVSVAAVVTTLSQSVPVNPEVQEQVPFSFLPSRQVPFTQRGQAVQFCPKYLGKHISQSGPVDPVGQEQVPLPSLPSQTFIPEQLHELLQLFPKRSSVH